MAVVRWETGVLEIRESRSNSAVKTIEDFPAVQHREGHNCLAFSEEVLAVVDHPTLAPWPLLRASVS